MTIRILSIYVYHCIDIIFEAIYIIIYIYTYTYAYRTYTYIYIFYTHIHTHTHTLSLSLYVYIYIHILHVYVKLHNSFLNPLSGHFWMLPRRICLAGSHWSRWASAVAVADPIHETQNMNETKRESYPFC